MRSATATLVALLIAITHCVAPLLHAHLDGRVSTANGIHLHLDGVSAKHRDTGLSKATDADGRAVGLTAEMKRGWRIDIEQLFLPIVAVPPIALAPPAQWFATAFVAPPAGAPPFFRPPAHAPPALSRA